MLNAVGPLDGLRCPSEVLSLRWCDIDGGKGRIRVPSPKTEHIKGMASRIIPLFPEPVRYWKLIEMRPRPMRNS